MPQAASLTEDLHSLIFISGYMSTYYCSMIMMRFDNEDQPYFVERKKEDIDKGETKDWWRLYAFCVVRRYDSDGDLDETYLYVNPQPLRQLLKDVIGYYPTDPIDVDDVQIPAPYKALFYFHKEVEEVGLKRFQENGDPQSLEQLKLLLGWINTTFELEIAAYDKCMSSDLKAIAYDKLWTIFKPGTIVHTQLQKANRAFRVKDHWYDDDEDEPVFNLVCYFVDYDGDRLGTRRVDLKIPKYSGVRDIQEQEAKPLELLENADEVREELLARGRRFERYAIGQHFMQYNGLGLKRDPNCPSNYLRFDASGRVILDVKTYHRLDPNDSIWVVKFGKDHANAELTEEDWLLANAMVRGYSLTAKKFLELSVDNLTEIDWNTRCFDDLVLDPATKKTVQALVATHSQERAPYDDKDTFDDIVKGKGKGLVCVLHGPPGVGKTLTAECVAEYVQRPLFMVSSGDLGVTSEQLDTQLTEIMDMASTWKAVLLIDEADVFLEQRALHDLHRNAMVSVFLRVLEYYAGILFLTTNRVATFDDAFKSRIHIPIRYTDLDVKSRLQIWRSFCKKVPGGVDILDAEYEILAEIELNGRQIKNVIKAAESLAAFDKVPLDFKQLQQVTKIQATFEKDLESFGDIDYTAPGSAKKHAASGHMYY
ncbi:hypothetical protein VPNG_09177 [Cytospora leucostoma]|uniref:AAA+ ATPase domain-containing protein n=1 Tax=Cytospora leucostoma TaxID=1230097 RepID=A0A423VYE4_9PEZI|nr:hypothetical protein VPNG_09177 [Cytospora leucostoma]